jgi:hypothetical protein
LLAAYRRDDWPTGELSALRRHLADCAACRRAEAEFRGVGEQIRRLPSRTPPPAFRAAVFAAIAAEQRRVAPTIARLSRAATNPTLPAVRPGPRPLRRADLRLGLRAALVAAALVLAFLGIRSVPSFSALSRIAGSLPASSGAPQGSAQPTAFSGGMYKIPDGYEVTSAMATGAWLVYGADDQVARITLFAESRQSKAKGVAFFQGDAAQLPTIRGLSDDWVLWTTGPETSGLWTLYARHLPLDGSSNAVLLSANVGDFANLSGIWTRGDAALVTGATAHGSTELVHIDLASGAQTVLASAPAGHLFTDPAALNGTYYWADVTLDPLNGLSSTLLRRDAAGDTAAPVVTATTSFEPAATRSTLVWVDVPRESLRMQTASADALTPYTEATLSYPLAGALRVQSGGMTLADDAVAASMQAGGNLVVWQTSANPETRTDIWYSFDLATHGASPWSRALSSAAGIAITDSAVVWWTRADATTLYVAPAA